MIARVKAAYHRWSIRQIEAEMGMRNADIAMQRSAVINCHGRIAKHYRKLLVIGSEL